MVLVTMAKTVVVDYGGSDGYVEEIEEINKAILSGPIWPGDSRKCL